MNAIKAAQFGLTDSDENYAVVVVGRRISLDALEDIGLTRGKATAIVDTVKQWARKSELPLCYVHMGTTVNWDEDEDAPIEEGADAIVGAVLAVAVYPGEPTRLAKSQLAKIDAAALPDGLWEELADTHGLQAEEPGLYLAPAGWTVAEIFPPDAVYDTSGECFAPPHQAVLATCAEDFPPGVGIDLGSLPDEVWLRAFYA